MDYLKLLPINVHEKIVKKLSQTKESVEITWDDDESILEITFSIKKTVFDVPKDIDNIYNKWFSSPNDHTFKYVGECEINKITYLKNSNIFFVNFHEELDLNFLFDTKQKIYFRSGQCLNLTSENNSSLFEQFKEWSYCNKCSKDKEETILLKQNCLFCKNRFKPMHINCFTKCKYSHYNKFEKKFICNNCVSHCIVCNKIVCPDHITRCKHNQRVVLCDECLHLVGCVTKCKKNSKIFCNICHSVCKLCPKFY